MIHIFMLIGAVSLLVMVYNYHNRPRVSNVLWYANVEPDFAELHQRLTSDCRKPECSECYRDAYSTIINRGRSAVGGSYTIEGGVQ